MRAALALALACLGCAGAPSARSSEPSPVQVSAFWIPVCGIEGDVDADERNSSPTLPENLQPGQGYGVHLSVLDGPGLMLLTTEHDEDSTRSHARMNAALLEYAFKARSSPGPSALVSEALIVGGVAGVDFGEGYDDRIGAALGFGIRAGFDLDWLMLRVSGVGTFIGYPSETIGSIGFFALELGVRF